MVTESLVLKAIKFLEKCQNDFTFEEVRRLGCGCERIAYSMGDGLVLKVRKDLFFDSEEAGSDWDERAHISEEYQTDREIEIWEKMSEDERAFFNPILAHGKYQGEAFIVTPYVEVQAYCEEEVWAEEVAEQNELSFDFRKLEKVAAKFGLDFCDMINNSNNFGINETGQLVITDFGLEEF